MWSSAVKMSSRKKIRKSKQELRVNEKKKKKMEKESARPTYREREEENDFKEGKQSLGAEVRPNPSCLL